MPRRTDEYGRHRQLRVADLLAGELAGHLVGQDPDVLRLADQVDHRQVDLDEMPEVAELEVRRQRVEVGRHRGAARVPGGQLGDDPRRRGAHVVHVQLHLGQAGDEGVEVGQDGCSLDLRHHEDAAEGEESAVVADGVRRRQPRAQLGPVGGPAGLVRAERRPDRAQRRALQPGQHGVVGGVAGKQVHVGSFPGVDGAARRGQVGRVLGGRRHRHPSGDAAQRLLPARRRGDLVERVVRRRGEVARHLEGEPRAGGAARPPSGAAAPRGRAPTAAPRWRP